MRKALALALHHPGAAARVEALPELARIDQPGVDLLRRLLEVAAARPQISTAGLLERFRDDPAGRHLGQLAGAAPLDDEPAALAVLRDCLERIVAASRRERLSALLERGASLSEEERAEARELLGAGGGPAERPQA
ncbi:MAG TPA: hypothetical protein VLD39_07580 [Gammaproteobacteria bacterium]|nr:hypothetical protein [Gammaproteobacteria bacterium]